MSKIIDKTNAFLKFGLHYMSAGSTVLLVSVLMLFAACTPATDNNDAEQITADMINLIPKPASISYGSGYFNLNADSKIYLTTDNPEVKGVAQQLAQQLRGSTGYALEVTLGEPEGNSIGLVLNDEQPGDSDEYYDLVVTTDLVTLSASAPEGLFRGIQTIRQLLPDAIESQSVQTENWQIPAVIIQDNPRYGYRGSMLDVSRHFFGVADVKRYIDLIAHYKMNILHLHLSDDQGWRIEIKSWPNLTTYGGSTQVGGGEGGFYTQEQYTEIVNYAGSKYITVVPEIDMPGHTNAALASYAQLNFEGKAPDLYTGTEVGFSSLTINQEITYEFIDDVIRELSALTPGPYIHIGADEAHATSKEDFILFVNRVQKIVESHGKSSIGWEEILSSDILPNSVVQYWNTGGEVTGFTPETKVIMSPASNSYLDMKYTDSTALGLNWAGNSDVRDSYEWDPVTLVERISDSDIIGVEAPLWSETIENMYDIEFLLFPRLPGIAEIGWSPKDGRDWDEYKLRLAAQGGRFEVMGINYFRSPLVPWKE